MSLSLRLMVLFIVTSAVFSPESGFAAKCKDQFYIISLKDQYLEKKYKVRAFFLYQGYDVYSITKMPNGWIYTFPDKQGDRLIGLAETDHEAVDIRYFKDFLSIIIIKDDKPYLTMTLICNKPNGTVELLKLETNDFVIKQINKCFKRYSLNHDNEP
ncbi:hypothetical protein [Candidatus Magnetominusculus xianensis]|uniref:Secreted protein n=1 Tax=Candidatus Magnetominusculus xianensis TaxID=1748249 RepID=A0ABR5SH41_9BACT|nr:hypothetical protein [Candidatus Magnetominusculus xianensis]KWT91014.1 hypothetical protein ASN18_0961 [Candidatus Magnetominusculus xianensis]MBF0402593.1 hypothetical protein [Nitrospirota bacterium]